MRAVVTTVEDLSAGDGDAEESREAQEVEGLPANTHAMNADYPKQNKNYESLASFPIPYRE